MQLLSKYNPGYVCKLEHSGKKKNVICICVGAHVCVEKEMRDISQHHITATFLHIIEL